ncbi:MAG: RHS repeat-associated core domain-containing protein [Chloroflexota bacterium]
MTHSSGLSHTDYGYTGESYSSSTQLTYLRARYYNPADGRFQSRDTWGGDGNRPMSMNRWMYTEGNPINRIDPSGYAASGYAEGTSSGVTGLFLMWSISGEEIVYNFETMERAHFRFTALWD